MHYDRDPDSEYVLKGFAKILVYAGEISGLLFPWNWPQSPEPEVPDPDVAAWPPYFEEL